jgi:hypothetical protein
MLVSAAWRRMRESNLLSEEYMFDSLTMREKPNPRTQ